MIYIIRINDAVEKKFFLTIAAATNYVNKVVLPRMAGEFRGCGCQMQPAWTDDTSNILIQKLEL